MPRKRNVELLQQIHSTADRILQNDPLTPCVVKDVTNEVWHNYFPNKTYNQAYQMVSYYLRGANKYVKRQNRYRSAELDNLMLMTPAGRSEYALARGVTPASVEQAVRRYYDSLTRPPAPLDRPWFNFSRKADLDARGFSIEEVRKCRDYLDENCGLALRAPNILYHPKTKRRYALSDTEQVALLMNPKQFLRARAAHIKANWVEKASDPIHDPDDALTIDAAAPTTSTSKLLTSRIRKLTKAITENPPVNVTTLLYAALSRHTEQCLKILQFVEAKHTPKEITNA